MGCDCRSCELSKRCANYKPISYYTQIKKECESYFKKHFGDSIYLNPIMGNCRDLAIYIYLFKTGRSEWKCNIRDKFSSLEDVNDVMDIFKIMTFMAMNETQ